MKNKYAHLLWALLCLPSWLMAQVVVQTPAPRAVFQRNNSNQATLPVLGSCPATATRIEARLIPRVSGIGTAVNWTVIDMHPANGTFRGQLTMTGGWYDLEVRAIENATILTTSRVERVGAGEVFIVCGHSVAHGNPNPIAGATDDRVSAIPLTDQALSDKYNKTGSPDDLPAVGFVQYGTGVSPAPFAYNQYFWSQFGEKLAQRLKVPVLIYNAAFGGTSLEHWALSSQGQWFDHSFVNAAIRMPYINLKNTLTKYVSLTGVRAILSDQGQNDSAQPNEDIIFNYYKTWVNQARTDIGFSQLACVVNRVTPWLYTSPLPHIRRAQERMIATPNCFPGPDYDTGMARPDRYDDVHLALSGQVKAAQLWADALDDTFFARSVPFLPTPVSATAGTTPPTTNQPDTNPGPVAGDPLKMTLPTYDCTTGVLIMNTKGGTNEPKQYMIESVSYWSSSRTITLPENMRQRTPLIMRVRQGAVISTYVYSTDCSISAPASETTTQPGPATNGSGSAAPQFAGRLEGSDCGRIWGWAANLNNLAASASVWIFIDGQLLGTVQANELRTDLKATLGGTGQYGFTFTVPSHLQTSGLHTVDVRFAGGQQSLENSSLEYVCDSAMPQPEATPQPSPTETVYGWTAGKLEGADCNRIWGWAADLNQSYTSVEVEIYLDGILAGSTTANRNRPDLIEQLLDNGLHGFDWEIPQAHRKEGTRSVIIRFANSQQVVDSARIAFLCGSTARYVVKEPVEKAWNLYPNPVEDLLTLTLPAAFDPASVSLTLASAQGTQYTFSRNEIQVSGQDIRIPVGSMGLQSGVYLLSISNDIRLLKTLKVLKR